MRKLSHKFYLTLAGVLNGGIIFQWPPALSCPLVRERQRTIQNRNRNLRFMTSKIKATDVTIVPKLPSKPPVDATKLQREFDST